MAMSDMSHNPNPLLISRDTKIGALHLRITSVERALPIWRDMVGLTVLEQTSDELVLGVDNEPLVYLDASAKHPVQSKSLGLYHIAIHVPTRKELARAIKRQMQAAVRTSPTDHLVSEATYLWDLDGNGIEMTFETPERGYIAHQHDGMRMVTTAGQPHSGLESIELEGLFSELDSSDDLAAPLPTGTRLGHVHVHVGDLEQSMKFYADVLGFQRQILSTSFGMGDVKTKFQPHILAFNIWSGVNANQPDDQHAGLKHFEIVVPDASEIDGVAARLEANQVSFERVDAGQIRLKDPAGNQIMLRT